jgi:hypothetical protein
MLTPSLGNALQEALESAHRTTGCVRGSGMLTPLQQDVHYKRWEGAQEQTLGICVGGSGC